MNGQDEGKARERRNKIRAALNEAFAGLEEAWRAIGRDESLSAAEKESKREEIQRKMDDIELREGRISDEALRARENDPELDHIIGKLEGAVRNIKDEIERMRRAERVARHVAKVLQFATKALGFAARFVV